MFGYGMYDVLIIAGFLAVQHFFSTRDSVYWGALIPIVFTVWRLSMIFTRDESVLSIVLILLVGLAFLIGEWVNGRNTLQAKREKELEKMKSHDM